MSEDFKNNEETYYEKIGGANKLQELVTTFYRIMDEAPEAKTVRAQHHPDLTSANEKLFLFLSGWLGGPSLYIEKYGHPRLRARHLPFKIGIREKDEWLFCMFKALEECQIPEPTKTDLCKSFAHIADFMRNQSEAGEQG